MQRELLGDYQHHLRRRGLAERTRKEYGTILRAYARDVDVLRSDTASIETWLDGRPLGPRARLTYVGCLAGFHEWLMDEGWRTDDPARKVIRPKVGKRLPRPVPTKDLEWVLAATSDARMKVWLCLGAYEGFRAKEIAGLEWPDVDFEHDAIRLIGKGDVERLVPLNVNTKAALFAYGTKPRGPVFPAKIGGHRETGLPMRPSRISTLVAEHLRGLGLNATGHQLRHWFGTEVYRKTRDIRLVSELMGHSDLRTTQGYVKLVPSAAAVDAVKKLSAAAGPTLQVESEGRARCDGGGGLSA